MIVRTLRNLFRRTPRASVPDLLERQKDQWTRLGREAPYWSVLSGCDRSPEIGEADEEEFYRSGADEVACLREQFEAAGAALPGGCCVDWGCGLGRVLLHLADPFEKAVGVDISRPHLDRARARADARFPQRASRCTWLHAVEDADAIGALHGRVDLVHSILVLQHMPPPLMEETLDTFARLLRPGGWAFFQIPTGAEGYDYTRYSLTHDGDFDMHALPEDRIRAVFRRHGCRECLKVEKDRTGPPFVSHYFLYRKEPGATASPDASGATASRQAERKS